MPALASVLRNITGPAEQVMLKTGRELLDARVSFAALVASHCKLRSLTSR